jgi:hypothetical protein
MQIIPSFVTRYLAEVIALAALALAIIHGRYLSKALRQLIAVTEVLPTQPLYGFPDFVPKIADLIEKANGPIIICCDQPAYGSFSDQSGYRRYAIALFKRISAGKSVKLYCMNEAGRRANTVLQFTQSGDEWKSFKASKRSKIESYLSIHPHAYLSIHPHSPITTVEDLENKDFIELIVQEDTHSLQSVFRDAEIVYDELEKKPPVYFWYADNTMIFVISTEHRNTENGFYTRDRSLINSLLDLTERYTGLQFRAGDAADSPANT